MEKQTTTSSTIEDWERRGLWQSPTEDQDVRVGESLTQMPNDAPMTKRCSNRLCKRIRGTSAESVR
ncbi:hypothetical protein [Rubripirellula tenax]|uniref:hypothetical protein n=1 Tax=Rubripirellula tenax TaxID=2528015 RepID=UPI0011B55566|nr:hypothetical protein [Rubripirellula tenax]